MARVITKKNPEKAFQKGLSELKVRDLPDVREALYRILRVTTPQGFRNYANGKVQTLDVDKARQIEALFAAYGVSNPWGL